jgi:hypothetical protein
MTGSSWLGMMRLAASDDRSRLDLLNAKVQHID